MDIYVTLTDDDLTIEYGNGQDVYYTTSPGILAKAQHDINVLVGLITISGG